MLVKSPATPTPPATNDAAALGPGAIAGAVVDFEAPVLGSDAPITGKLSGVPNPADYQVLILVSANMQSWWDKTHNVHGVPIESDGVFTIKSWVVDPHDRTVANVGIWSVLESFDISWNAYQVEGKPLPDKVKQAAAAVKIQHRQETTTADAHPAREHCRKGAAQTRNLGIQAVENVISKTSKPAEAVAILSISGENRIRHGI